MRETLEQKIKEMFDATFQPRAEFNSLSESSQDLLLGQLQDGIIDGVIALEKDFQSQIQQREELLKEKINHFPSIRFKGSRWVDAKNLDDLLKEIKEI